MSFSTILTYLQSLISRSFALSSFSPSLAFWFANGLMLFALNGAFRTFVLDNLNKTAGAWTLIITAVVAGIAMVAYVLSALLPAIQTFMEGNWPSWAVSVFSSAQMKRFERLEEEIERNDVLRGSLGILTSSGQTQVEFWQDSLTKARQLGEDRAANDYTFGESSAKRVYKLAKLRRRSRAISASDINAAVAALVFDLRANNANLPGPKGDRALEETRRLLWDLIEYADQFAASEYRRLLNERQFTFGDLPLAPTRMGNVARTVQSYAVERYDFNFELFWSRLQFSAQTDKDFGPRLESAKTQLDFLIACSFLTFVWACFWALWLIATAGPPLLFLGVSLLGPLLAWIWYRVAVAQYRTFADVLRSSIDLFRLTLLQQLHYPRPDGVCEERDLWQNLDALHALYELRDIRYSHPKS